MIDTLSADQIRRVYEVTDRLRLDRDSVVVPLFGRVDGIEMILPDGKLLVRPPAGPAFDPWLAGLRGRLELLDFVRTRRA
jgi:hypothetical protein